MTQTQSAVTSEDWQASFTQPGSNLELEMLGAAGTRVITGEGLGPDLRVPVPFVMVRREGISARFVALYVPYREESAVKGFRAVSDTEYEVTMTGSRDRISIAAGEFRVGH